MQIESKKSAVTLKRLRRGFDRSSITVELKIDLIPGRKRIMRDLVRAVAKFIPYRSIDPRIFQAIVLVASGTCGFKDASVRIFQTGRKADDIRHWFNRLNGGEL